MAAIAQTTVLALQGPVNLTRTTLTASDTFTYNQGSGQRLFLYNTTAAIVTVTINGSTPVTITVPGYGGTVSTASGKSVSVPANGSTLVELDDMYNYLQGATVTVTGGTGLVAHLYN